MNTGQSRKSYPNEVDRELYFILKRILKDSFQSEGAIQPSAPYIADRIEIGAMADLKATKWTGDMSKCLGWIALFPEEIRGELNG